MEQRLLNADYLLTGGFTIADIALYAYTHVAHEGGFDLDAYPGIRAWLARIAGRPAYRPMRPAPA